MHNPNKPGSNVPTFFHGSLIIPNISRLREQERFVREHYFYIIRIYVWKMYGVKSALDRGGIFFGGRVETADIRPRARTGKEGKNSPLLKKQRRRLVLSLLTNCKTPLDSDEKLHANIFIRSRIRKVESY